MDESRRCKPIDFEEEEFNDIKKLERYIIENKYVIDKKEEDLYYLSRIHYDVEGLRMSIFLSEDEKFKQIAYIDSTYAPFFKILNISIFNVNPSYRNKGYGTLLYNAFEAKVLSLYQIKTINGSLAYWKEGKKREKFFESLGFELSSLWNDRILNKMKKDFD